LNLSAKTQRSGKEEQTRVIVENPGPELAFFLHLQIKQGTGGEEVLPVIWDDNYFSLLPGEKREISATYAPDLVRGPSPMVELAGWNTVAKSAPITR
jgi:exo-1,4-beta-D-glucosaminidase